MKFKYVPEFSYPMMNWTVYSNERVLGKIRRYEMNGAWAWMVTPCVNNLWYFLTIELLSHADAISYLINYANLVEGFQRQAQQSGQGTLAGDEQSGTGSG